MSDKLNDINLLRCNTKELWQRRNALLRKIQHVDNALIKRGEMTKPTFKDDIAQLAEDDPDITFAAW